MSVASARASPLAVARVPRCRRSTAPRVVRWPSASNIAVGPLGAAAERDATAESTGSPSTPSEMRSQWAIGGEASAASEGTGDVRAKGD